MTRIKQAGPSVLVVALIAGIIGYIFGCTRTDRDRQSEAHAAQADTTGEQSKTAAKSEKAEKGEPLISPTEARARDFYVPNGEDLDPNEIRIIACGTGMPH